MNRLLSFISFLLLSSAIMAGPIPFDPSRGLVEVEVVINGMVKGTFGIDTGADAFFIDADFARENGLKITPAAKGKYVVGIVGTSEASEVEIRSLRIGGGETVYNLTAMAFDMDLIASDKSIEPPDGLIGFDILRRFYVHVNYPDATMELISHEPDFLKRGSGFVTVPFRQEKHLILVEVDFGDGVIAPMVFDYCASLSTISPGLADKLGLEPDESGRVVVSEMGISNDVWQYDVQALVTDHGDFQKGFPEGTFEGILGASFLYRWEITVDYKRQRIYVH